MAMQKQEKMEYVAEHVLKIILARGLNRLSYAQVAKSAGVSRAWLYKYVGQTKEDLIAFAVAHFGKIFSALEQPVVAKNREEFTQHAIVGLQHLFGVTQKYPWALPLYFRYVGTRTVIGETIKRIETMYFNKVVREIETFMKPKKLDPRATTEVLAYLNFGIALRWQHAYPGDVKFAKEVEKVVHCFLDSIA